MDILQLMQSRYTTKVYDPTKKLSDEQIQTLKEVLRLSPSSINSQPWKFLFVGDTDLKNKLAEHSQHNAEKVRDASHVVVFCKQTDVQAFADSLPSYLPQPAVDYFNNHVRPLPDAHIQTWMTHQTYLALGIFLTACASMDIDSTPMEGIDRTAYTQLLAEDGYDVVLAVAIGHRDEKDYNQPSLNPKRRKNAHEVLEER